MTIPNHCKDCTSLKEASRKGLKKSQAKTPWCEKQSIRADHGVIACKVYFLKEQKS